MVLENDTNMRNIVAFLLLLALALGCNSKPTGTANSLDLEPIADGCKCAAPSKPQTTPVQAVETTKKTVSPFDDASKHITRLRGSVADLPLDRTAVDSQLADLTALKQAEDCGDLGRANELCAICKQKSENFAIKCATYKNKIAAIEKARLRVSQAIDEAIVSEKQSRDALAQIPANVERYKTDPGSLQQFDLAVYIGTLHRLRSNELSLDELLGESRKALALAVANLNKEDYKGFVNVEADPLWQKLESTNNRLKAILETDAASRRETEPFFSARRADAEKSGIKGLSDNQLLPDADLSARIQQIEDYVAKRLLEKK